VIHCGDTSDEISEAISYALSPEGRARAARAENPYFQPDTVAIMVDAIMHFDTTNPQKKFYDLK
jgi:hypothetical protein